MSQAIPRAAARKTLGVPIAIGALVTWTVATGLQQSWKVTLGWLLEQLAGLGVTFSVLGRRVGLHPFSPLRAVSRSVYNALGRIVALSERGLVYSLNALLELPLLLVGTVAAIAYLLWEVTHRQKDYADKAATTKVATNVQPQLKALRHDLAVLKAEVAALPHAKIGARGKVAAPAAPITLHDWQLLRRGIDRIAGRLQAVEKRVGIGAGAHAGAIARPLPVARPVASSWKHVLTRKAAVALTLAGILGLGMRWLRCAKVGKVGRAICGVNAGALDFLLGSALLAFALSDVCRLVTGMQRAAEAFEPALLAFVNEVGGYVCGGKGSAPSGIVDSDWQPVTRLPSGLG